MLLTIDFLILNFKGKLTEDKQGFRVYALDHVDRFELIAHQYGNKTFSEVYGLFWGSEKIGTVNAVPRSSIIASDLIQIQFENHLFYTKNFNDLGRMVNAIRDYFDLTFEGINRLDIALDKNDYNDKYQNLYIELIQGSKKIKGREKNVSAYMLTKNGSTEFNGFTIGKRSSSRFLRIYNKTKALLQPKQPKTYINEYFAKNGLTDTANNPVWRFEYQLNSTFFTYLRDNGRNITHQIFELETLINLIELAERNHFEIVENTGKAETNKEKAYKLHSWQDLYDTLTKKAKNIIVKVTKVFEPSITVQKRLIKSLFRQYYIEQNLAFLYPMAKIINQYKLKDWFYEKYQFYMQEFQNREKIKDWFNETFFIERYAELVR